MTWPTGDEIARQFCEKYPTVGLSFSCGKDSIAAWLQLLDHGAKKVVPVYFYALPGLKFIEDSLKYYEDKFSTRIYRLPHPSFYRKMAEHVAQPYHQAVAAELSGEWPKRTYRDWLTGVAADEKIPPEDFWTAVGTRSADGPIRRLAFRKYGPVRQNSVQFYPVWDWNKERLVSRIRSSGVKLPPEYRIFGRSFDGIDFRFLWGVRQHWPEDYATILKWFPLIEAEFARHGFSEKRRAAQPAE